MTGENRLGEAEDLLVRIGLGEYLAQTLGGIPMSQGEMVRPSDLGLAMTQVAARVTAAVEELIATGNTAENRLERLREFWRRVEQTAPFAVASIFLRGIAPFFSPRSFVFGGVHAQVGLDAASYYSTAPLRETLAELVSLECLNAKRTRLTVGAVNVRSGAMRYFDSREAALSIDHVMASGALPPAFPAIRIDGEPYWDGGVYSNTPIEAVLDDKPRRDSVIFGVNVWQPSGPEPQSVWQVLGRQKDIQYASRADSHIARQKQIHHLRHVISELAALLPPEVRESMHCRDLTSWGCRTTMHVVRLLAPTLDSEDYLKDIDFTPAGIRARWQAGLADTRRMIERAPWETEVDPMEGVIVHELSARTGMEIRETA